MKTAFALLGIAWAVNATVGRPAALAAERVIYKRAAARDPLITSTTPAAATFVYKAIGERQLQVVVHYPAGWTHADRRPALLCFEGGGDNPRDKDGTPYPLAAERTRLGLPVGNAGPGRGFAAVAEHFAGRGLVCFRVEYRKRKTDGVLPDKAVEDAKSAMRWVRAHAAELGVDAARVVATGASSGGHLAASLAALREFDAPTDDRAISCVPLALILHSPLLDFVEGGTRTTPFLSALDNDRVLGERLSPARHWSTAMPPTLLFTGAKEPVHDILYQFARKWRDAGQRIELVTGEGGHVYSLNDKWLAGALARMEEFLTSVGCLGVPMAVLRHRLQSPDLTERSGAVLGLLRLGSRAAPAFPELVALLADDEALDHRVAARVLYARARPPADVPALLEGLKHDTKTRAAAAWELSRVGLPAGDAVTRALLAALHHPDKHERNFVVLALATTAFPGRQVAAALEGVLRDEGSPTSPQTNYRYPRESAASALELIKTESPPAPAAGDVRALMATLANTPGRIDREIVEGLRALGAFAGANRPVAKKGTRKTAPPVHESIALALGYLDSLTHPPAPTEMIAAARDEQAGGFPAAIRQYVMALGGLQQGIGPTLRETWAQAQRDPRVHAVRGLAALGPAAREAVPSLRAALDDTDWIIRREAFLALRRIVGDPADPSVKEDR